MKHPVSLLVLIVCRNRRDITLAAIDRIKRQTAEAAVSIAVLDDASTDGTPEAITASHPDVRLEHSNGNAFWNGGLHQLWSATRDAPVEAFLWLNDDTFLDEDALERLLITWRAASAYNGKLILVGATRGSDGALSYSGYDVAPSPFAFSLQRVVPDPETIKPITTFNGNIVLVGRGAMEAIGLNDPAYFHNLGDIDYGLRAQQAAIPVLLLPGTLGVCEGNAAKRQQGYGSSHLSIFGQWRKVNSHHGLPFSSWWRFTRRHSGVYWPLHFLIPYRHLLRLWRLRDRSSTTGGNAA